MDEIEPVQETVDGEIVDGLEERVAKLEALVARLADEVLPRDATDLIA